MNDYQKAISDWVGRFERFGLLVFLLGSLAGCVDHIKENACESLAQCQEPNRELCVKDSEGKASCPCVAGYEENAEKKCVEVAANAAKDITSFTILNNAGTISASAISLTVPFGTSLTSLTPTIVHTGRNLSPASGVPQNFTSPVNYTVTAADSSTKVYSVIVAVAPNWTLIPGGSYQMGSTAGNPDEQPVHKVTVADFGIMKNEVTVAQYLSCTQAGACSNPNTGGNCNWGMAGKENHPINCVSWKQAVDFCTWVMGRLPSEAEWEYAARGGGLSRIYPWGDQAPTCQYAVIKEDTPGCGTGGTWPVCSLPAGNTPQGLCDMAGNVFEWIQDWYLETYEGAPQDGSAREAPAGLFRVIRGGSWYMNGANARSSGPRHHYNPTFLDHQVGFRCVRNP